MFNKKKRHIDHNRPHYTRQPGDPGSPGENEASPSETTISSAPDETQKQAQNQQEQKPVPQVMPPTAAPVQVTAVPQPQPVALEKAQPEVPQTPPAPAVVQGLPQAAHAVQPPNQIQDAPVTVLPNPNPAVSPNVTLCPICNMPIRNQYTTVRQQKTGQLVHFDCALRDLSKEFYPKLGRFKKIYYIGAGNFAVVKEFYDRRGHLKNYEILEKIAYEAREK